MTLQASSRTFPSFSLLSFDIFGTLIDWETGIETALRSSPYFSSLDASHPLASRDGLLRAAEQQERRIQAEQPGLVYSGVLAAGFKAMVSEYNLTAAAGSDTTTTSDGHQSFLDSEATRFGNSVGNWPAFPDTVAGLQRLAKHYKLVPLSNVDNASVAASAAGPLAGVPFAAVYTAQNIGSYKPDPRNFDYLLAHVQSEFGVEKDRVLHVAQSLYHDHVPASAKGIESVWVDRKNANMGDVSTEVKEKARFGWRVESIGELADLVDEAFAKEQAGR